MNNTKSRAGRIWGPLKKYLDRLPEDHRNILEKKLLIIVGLGLSISNKPNLEEAFKCYGMIQIKKNLLNEFCSHLSYIENKLLLICPDELYDLRISLENQSHLCEKLIMVLLNKK
jgi:hypothetical protein